ncbi:response regulator [Telluria beijingensis]|uniref:response regulator n=1 Tax=Telluria beijingensis TaxID=3068633 RepID=UPI0027952730|nr:response regulator [Massilia sp. REN29]
MNQPSCILVVDDHADIRDPLAAFLRRHDLEVLTAADAASARTLLRQHRIDLVVLDIMLPGEDGLSLCRHLAETSSTPVILLTAMAGQDERVAGLEIGADDYVTKPFDPRELVARIKGMLRRLGRAAAGRPERCYAFGDWTLDMNKRELRDAGGEPVALSSSEFRLLGVLVERAGKVLSRDELLDLTRDGEVQNFDRSIDSQVSRLRKKLESDPRRPRLLKTSWGDGYVFTADVRPLPAAG